MVKESLRISGLITSRAPLISPKEALTYGRWQIPAGVSRWISVISQPSSSQNAAKLDSCQYDSARSPSRSFNFPRTHDISPRAMAASWPRTRRHESGLRPVLARKSSVPWYEVSIYLSSTIPCQDTESRHKKGCLLYTSPSPRDLSTSRMPSSA